MNSNPFIHVRSSKLAILPGEDEELVNEGMYGKAFAQYLQNALAQRGYQTPNVVCEDWGWWVAVAGMEFPCGIGVYGVRIGVTNELDLCTTVLTPKGKKWMWSRFKSVDTTAEVERLHQSIRSICEADDEITIVAETLDFPLG